ncbi:hypothetical protein D3C73_1350930 [compost metagenome]
MHAARVEHDEVTRLGADLQHRLAQQHRVDAVTVATHVVELVGRDVVVPHLQCAALTRHVQVHIAGELRIEASSLITFRCVLGENVVMGQEAHAGFHHPRQPDIHLATVEVLQMRAGRPRLVEHATQGIDRR